MKKIYLSLVLNALVICLEAQNFQWAKREGLYAYDYGYGITTDNVGNVYVAGKYEENADFSNTTLPCVGNHDIYVAQYSSLGTLNWIKTGGGLNGDYAESISCDGSNLVYISGEIEGYGNTIYFPGSTFTLQCIGDNDIFFAKYDLNGNLLMVKSEGWKYSEKALGITYDNSGNIYIGGYYTDTTMIGGNQINGYGGRDIFIAKYNANGNFQWVKNAGSAGRDEIKSIKCDASGNVYVCGMFSNGAIFGTQTLTCTPGYFDAFVAKYATDGTLQWVKKSGGDYDDVAWSLVLDNQNKIYITGEFNAYALFDAIPLTTIGNADIFVSCYDGAGNVQWAKQAGGSLIDRARGIGSDGTNLFITGQFGSTAYFDSHSVIAIDNSDIFIASLNNSGNFLWANSVGGVADSAEALGYESGNAICAEAVGNVYATGGLLNGGVFGSTTVTGYSRTDVFITKLSAATITANTVENKIAKNIYMYPNPSEGHFVLDMRQLPDQKIILNIYNCIGQLVIKESHETSSKVQVDLSSFKEGVYLIEVETKDRTLIRKKIILHD